MDLNGTQFDNATDVLKRHHWPTGLFMAFAPSVVYIDRFITPIWYVIGIFTNPISAFIWLNRRIRKNNSSAIYLGALSINDCTFLVLHLICELQIAWGIKTFSYQGWCGFYNFVYMIPQISTPLLVLGFTVERWIAVCKPFHKERYCTVQRAIYVVSGLFSLSTALASVQIYIWTYVQSLQVCTYRENEEHLNFTTLFVFSTELLLFGIVPLSVLIFNILVIIEIRKITKANAIQLPNQGPPASNNAASTITLLSVSFYLIFTTLPVTLVFVLNNSIPLGDTKLTDDEIRVDPVWSNFFLFLIIRRLIEELCFSHYSCYFFVYCLTGPQFRKAVCSLLPVKLYQALTNEQQAHYSIVTGNGRLTNESCTTYV